MTMPAVAGRILIALLLAFTASRVCAHEVRPAYLAITQQRTGDYSVLWKQPAIGEKGVRLVPHLSGGALERTADVSQLQADAALRIWNVRAGGLPLEQQSLSIEGLERTITDVLVKVSFADGHELRQLLRPENPAIALGHKNVAGGAFGYLRIGVEHILGGFDHLLFVFALVLLVRRAGTLLKTITAFTAAHSITLAATTLNLLHPRPAVVEVLVALSIVLLAVELVRSYRGAPGVAARFPWAIAFAFGLLHGAAFAGALLDIGLPPDDVPLAVLLFNAGVEFGQLLFVAAVLLAIKALRRLPTLRASWLRFVPPYVVGSLAAAWTIERMLVVFV